MDKLTAILRCARGASAIEYALVASIISVAAIAGIMGVGSRVVIMFTNISTHLPG